MVLHSGHTPPLGRCSIPRVLEANRRAHLELSSSGAVRGCSQPARSVSALPAEYALLGTIFPARND